MTYGDLHNTTEQTILLHYCHESQESIIINQELISVNLRDVTGRDEREIVINNNSQPTLHWISLTIRGGREGGRGRLGVFCVVTQFD